jgi:pyruvate dehydrogenase E2 component (dihydrolipoamide acetyltransferase)
LIFMTLKASKPFTLTMPKLSPTMEEGTLVEWVKKEGDFVKAGDVIFKVATDKATVEHSVLDEGYIRLILIPNGGTAIVNQATAVFTINADDSIEGYEPEGDKPQAQVKDNQTVMPAHSHPAGEEVTPKASGLAQPVFVPEPPLKEYVFGEAQTGYVLATPLAKKLAKERNIDLNTVAGTGPNNRVTSQDVGLGQLALPVTFGGNKKPALIPGSYIEEKLSPMRRVIGNRLQASKTFIPHFYVMQEIRAEKLVEVQDQLKNMGHKISINDLVVRATALSLKAHPGVNSGFNSETQSIIRFQTIDISIAVSLDSGLVTPIIRHADYKNLGQLSTEIKQLAYRARNGKLSREEYIGGSFTISNLGMYKISEFIAVINPPQAAILAVAGIEDRAVVEKGLVIAGKSLRLTLSGDHRVFDGIEGAKFLKTLQKYLENPSILVM